MRLVRIILPLLVLAAVLGCNLAPASPGPGGSPTSSPSAGSPAPEPTPSPSPRPSAAPTPTPSPSPTIDPLEAAVSRSLEAMSDREKVGQLIMAGYSGADGVEAAAELVG